MQTGPSKLLHNLYGPASRTFQLNFHTSTCTLKGFGLRSRSQGNKSKSSSRTSARRRLVPSLKPDKGSGTYEVAPRQFKSRDKPRFPEERTFIRDKPILAPIDANGSVPSSVNKTRTQKSFDSRSRRNAGGHPSSESWESREGRDNRETAGPLFGHRQRIGSSRRNDSPRSKHEPRNPPPSSDRYSGGVSYGEQIARIRRPWEDRIKNNEPPPVLFSNSVVRPRSINPLLDEFDLRGTTEPSSTLPHQFSSPPLIAGLLQSVHDVLGTNPKPTSIQALSLKHLFDPPFHISAEGSGQDINTSPSWKQYLLASETGSGKSIAYLLPMIQYLKLTENNPAPLPSSAPPPPARPFPITPRGLLLSPTHELSRQLSSFAKALLHNVRLRVLCASQANNTSSSRGKSSTASQLKRELEKTGFGLTHASSFGGKKERPIDILVSTPMKALEMVRGWGWDKASKIEEEWDDARKERARNWVPGSREMGLSSIEWVVVDEADILFDPDFQESVRMLLADIAQARGYTHPSFANLKVRSATPPASVVSEPLEYPFHLVLTSATIPASLAKYLTENHPKLTRLASPNLHHLPSTLKTEHYPYASGNKNSDIEKRIKQVWAEDASTRSKTRSKILIFCNKSSKVDDLGLYLTEKGIPNLALTSSGQARHHGSNRHLSGFLKPTKDATPHQSVSSTSAPAPTSTPTPTNTATPQSQSDPHIMITTSLLSRGLDFSPQIKHVFIVDEPRNLIDFLHRAGRSGRAGNEGHVVIFAKMKGRGSGNAKDLKKKIGALT